MLVCRACELVYYGQHDCPGHPPPPPPRWRRMLMWLLSWRVIHLPLGVLVLLAGPVLAGPITEVRQDFPVLVIVLPAVPGPALLAFEAEHWTIFSGPYAILHLAAGYDDRARFRAIQAVEGFGATLFIEDQASQTTPEPATLLLLGSAMALAGWRMRRPR